MAATIEFVLHVEEIQTADYAENTILASFLDLSAFEE